MTKILSQNVCITPWIGTLLFGIRRHTQRCYRRKMCVACWKKARPKYKQHVLNIYPDSDDEKQQRQSSPEAKHGASDVPLTTIASSSTSSSSAVVDTKHSHSPRHRTLAADDLGD